MNLPEAELIYSRACLHNDTDLSTSHLKRTYLVHSSHVFIWRLVESVTVSLVKALSHVSSFSSYINKQADTSADRMYQNRTE